MSFIKNVKDEALSFLLVRNMGKDKFETTDGSLNLLFRFNGPFFING